MRSPDLPAAAAPGPRPSGRLRRSVRHETGSLSALPTPGEGPGVRCSAAERFTLLGGRGERMKRVFPTVLLAAAAWGQAGLICPGVRAADEAGKQAALPEEVFGRWVHSREEDAGGVRVFRPADYQFPPSRGR